MTATFDAPWPEYFTEWGRRSAERAAVPLQQIHAKHLTNAEVNVAPERNLETNVRNKKVELDSDRPAHFSESDRSDDGDLSTTYEEALSPADIHRPLIIDGSKSE
ncbi:hypothetical protein KEM54_001373 [Ascosphaera aggregata]|nr:hypothetical protein KEM54_001373 [Ascosphaera aggregata]